MTLKTAIRTFYRIINGPTGAAMADAEMCDAHFDGGEWSGPAHARMWQDWTSQINALVAERFGINPDTLSSACEAWHHEENNHFLDAIYARRAK